MFGLSRHDDNDDYDYAQQDDADNLPMMIPGQDYTPAHSPAPAPIPAPAQQPIGDISFSSPYTMHQPKPATKVQISDGSEEDDDLLAPMSTPQDDIAPKEDLAPTPETPPYNPPEEDKTEYTPQPAPSYSDSSSDDLASIKDQALKSLAPIVSHIDQLPEEKFRTIMGMIKSADSKDLIPQAYEAAKNIDNEKARAQALLDVVNQIDHFTNSNK